MNRTTPTNYWFFLHHVFSCFLHPSYPSFLPRKAAIYLFIFFSPIFFFILENSILARPQTLYSVIIFILLNHSLL